MSRLDATAALARKIGVRAVFGPPVQHDGVVLVPVAVSVGGGGTGSGPASDGARAEGGGMGYASRPLGAYAMQGGRVRFIPVVDVTALAVLALVALRLLRGRRPTA